MKYYYPDDLEAPPMLFFWTLQDISIISIGAVLSLVLVFTFRSIFPPIPVLLYAIITLRFFDVSIYDYLSKVGRHFLTGQQIFFWEEERHESI